MKKESFVIRAYIPASHVQEEHRQVRKYDEKTKACTLELYDKLGIVKTSELTGIPRRTISNWARARKAIRDAFKDGRKYKDDVKKRALNLADSLGVKEAARLTGVPHQTISWWRWKGDGVETETQTEPVSANTIYVEEEEVDADYCDDLDKAPENEEDLTCENDTESKEESFGLEVEVERLRHENKILREALAIISTKA